MHPVVVGGGGMKNGAFHSWIRVSTTSTPNRLFSLDPGSGAAPLPGSTEFGPFEACLDAFATGHQRWVVPPPLAWLVTAVGDVRVEVELPVAVAIADHKALQVDARRAVLQRHR